MTTKENETGEADAVAFNNFNGPLCRACYKTLGAWNPRDFGGLSAPGCAGCGKPAIYLATYSVRADDCTTFDAVRRIGGGL